MDEKMITMTEHRLSVHEQVCAERYEGIQNALSKGDKRMSKIEYLLYAVIVCVLMGPGVAATFFHKLFGM
jgi:hypothetical protein